MPDAKRIIAATAGVAAATGIAVAAWRKLAQGGDGSSKDDGLVIPTVIYHLKPDAEMWAVEAQDAEQASTRHETKREALKRARALAKRHAPSKLIIHRSDGRIQRQHAYGVDG